MLICESWTENWKEYFYAGGINHHIQGHPLQKECIDYFIKNKLENVEYKDLEGKAKASLHIKSGIDFSNFKYFIEIEENLSEETKIEAFVHEITHGHYLNLINVTKQDEKLITNQAKHFFEKNKSFCKNRYENFINNSQHEIPFPAK